ncbi:MAG: HD domain-containing phosphohydrolase [Sphingomonadales bacterium]
MEQGSKILVVDDDGSAREEIISYLSRKGFDCLEADDGLTALDVLKDNSDVDVVLTDIRMPGLDGLEFVRRARESTKRDLEFVIMTGHGGKDHAIQALRLAACDYIEKPLKLSEVWRALERAAAEVGARRSKDKYLEGLREEVGAQHTRLDLAYVEVLESLKVAADHKDPETANHIRRIGAYSRVLAECLQWDEKRLDLIERAAPMHDIGKIGTPDRILLKPGKLTPDEVVIMKQHAENGHHILLQSNHEMTDCAATIALSHHEKWDGSGYPNGLKGEEIPIEGRIVALVDVYDALRSERPYKPAFDHAKSMAIMLAGDGRTMPGHFDPQLLTFFKGKADLLSEIFERLAD